MGARLSTSRRQPPAEAVEVQTSRLPSTPVSERECLERPFQGSSEEFRRFHLTSTRESRNCIHNAIKMRDLDYLKFLVEDSDSLLEETSDQGVTPLYNAVMSSWTDGALLLLKHGADVRNADQSLSGRSCYFPSLVSVVLQYDSIKLLKEVIKRGAAINVLEFEANNCIGCCNIHSSLSIRNFLYKKVIEKKLQKGQGLDSLIVLFDAVYSGLYAEVNISKMKNIIKWKHSLEEGETMLVLGAWQALRDNHRQALKCWRKALRGRPHLQTNRQVKASDSVFADILHVDLLDLLNSPEDRDLDVRVQTLLVLEKYTPTDKELTLATIRLALGLYRQDKELTVIEVMHRLTSVRALHKDEIALLVKELKNVFTRRSLKELPFAVLLNCMVILTRCLSFLTKDGCFSRNKSLVNRHDVSDNIQCCNVCLAMTMLRDTFLRTISYFDQVPPATAEQLQDFHHHVKDFLIGFPGIPGQNLFHCLVSTRSLGQALVFVIKTLVVCSAETKGTNRHVNSPPHLASDKNGDTPLHVFARYLTRKQLVEGGVLQCCLDHGAHLCTRNNRGQSVRDILLEREVLEEEQTVLSLQCLAATAFMNDAHLRRIVHTCHPDKVRHFLQNH